MTIWRVGSDVTAESGSKPRSIISGTSAAAISTERTGGSCATMRTMRTTAVSAIARRRQRDGPARQASPSLHVQQREPLGFVVDVSLYPSR